MTTRKNKTSTLLLVAFLCISCSIFDRKDDTSAPVNGAASPTPAASPSASVAAVAAAKRNLLSFGAGAHLLKFPVPSSSQFSSHNLFDDADAFWISNENEGTDQVFVVGLPGETTFESFSFINGSDYYGEGSGAKDIVVEVSNTSADGGYAKVLETSLPFDIDPAVEYPATAKLPARFLKLTVRNTHGNPARASLGELRGFGEQKIDTSQSGLTGTYIAIDQDEKTLGWAVKAGDELKRAGTYSDIYLRQNGTQLHGCDANSKGRYFNGGIDGNSGQASWDVVAGAEPEPFVMTFADGGKLMFLANITETGTVSRFTAFQKQSDTPGSCSGIAGFDSGGGVPSQIEKDLADDGRAVVYGINFDFNSDTLRPESKSVLDEVAGILKQNADWKMTVEGHTDNVGGESFNMDLSQRRAASVKNYLTAAGIAAERLESAGHGLSKPIAPNETEIGRARNRRVELVKR